MGSLCEKYRPQTWDAVIGQEKAVSTLKRFAWRGGEYPLGGRAWWVSGPSGTGKTTLARIIAGTIAHPLGIQEWDGARLNLSDIASIEEAWGNVSGGFAYGLLPPYGHAVIINEAHKLKASVITALLVTLESLPDCVAWIFTTTNEGQVDLLDGQLDAQPLLSRCVRIALTSQGLCRAFAARAREIAVAEGLDGAPVAAYERLAKDCKNNMRAMLQAIDAGLMLAQ